MSTTNMEIPSEFICPITMEVMVYPMASRHGPNFERAAIVAWLEEGSEVCPLTRKPMTRSDLIHNRLLAIEIKTWHKANNVPYAGDQDDEDVAAAFGDVLCQMYGTSQCRYKAVIPMAHGAIKSTGTTPGSMSSIIVPSGAPRSINRRLRPSFVMPWKQQSNRR